MKTAYTILAITLLAITLGSCHLIGSASRLLGAFDTTAHISTWRGNTIRQGRYIITVADARIDQAAYDATGGAALRWLVLNVTVADTCRDVLLAGVQRFPLMPHECPVVPLWPPPLIPASDDTNDYEPSGGSDR